MEIQLTNHQIRVIQKYNDDINSLQKSLQVAQGLRDSFISGIGSANGKEDFAFQIKDGVLIIDDEQK